MSGWGHERGRICVEPTPDDEGRESPCLCDDPTPDPTSPCGMVRSGYMTPCDADPVTRDAEGWEQASYERKAHRYLPTRCTCGHAIEAVR